MSTAAASAPGPTCLGVTPHPALGLRLPRLFLPGILSACRTRGTAPGLMLSYGRETAPQEVIDAPPGSYEITLGHTGTSIREYLTTAAQAAREAGVTCELEADHLIIGSATAAVQRIAGYHAEGAALSPAAVEESLAYNRRALDEAAATGVIGCFTTDTSALFWLPADELSDAEVEAEAEAHCTGPRREALLARYARPVSFPRADGGEVRLELSPVQAQRLALKFADSLAVNAELYAYCRSRLAERPFSFEISLDETAALTSPVETLFYLTEWAARGLPCHFFAPNLGFGKRADFSGDQGELQERAAVHHALAQGICGALLSIHSGSGTTPYSGKGPGTYQALRSATGGQLKYKISGVYYELLLELLAAEAPGSAGRALYERCFEEVLTLLEQQVAQGGPLAQPLLVEQLEDYRRQVTQDPARARDPRADFFRFQSYLALNLRQPDGRRHLREALHEYVAGNEPFRRRLDLEVEALTLRLIDGLGFAGNME